MRSWLKNWDRKESKRNEEIRQDRLLLLQEIRQAHMDWVTAQRRFDYVVEKEQIDYAVYALEAAEKRFEMLIKQAKDIKLVAGEVAVSRAMGE
ncbi:DUF2508 family protein [Paenibacillus sp. GD4]|jgi:hypothetical protein|uniref:DUF2508 family protein n=1 Tax=Paenibacillus sp. GD4 TaxID=3068890 RepID=UPI00279640B5|nr:DUF2508 family protein [Paenibacillus sp. GD4]MDQ1910975.1 DUF2508 family protein [Paenibacillus sp. GD4]